MLTAQSFFECELRNARHWEGGGSYVDEMLAGQFPNGSSGRDAFSLAYYPPNHAETLTDFDILPGSTEHIDMLLDLPLPLLCAHALPSPSFSLPPPSSAPPPPLPLPCDVNEAFGVSAASSVVGGLLTELAFLPRLVLATEVAATLGDRSSKLGSAEAARYGRMGAAQWLGLGLG